MDGAMIENPFLSGNYAPVHSEETFELVVRGDLPKALSGTLLRIGPNPQFPPRGDYHWFTGDGMVHAFRLQNGQVTYRNRYVHTPRWEIEHAAGRALFGSFGDDDPSVEGRDSGVANTNVVRHGGRLMALEEAHRPFELAHDLSSTGYLEAYGGPTTAHPKIDPQTGEMIWFGYGAGSRPLSSQIAYGVTSAEGTVVRREIVDAPYSAMIHDFMVTANHVLLPVLPLTGSIERAMAGLPAYAWEPQKGAFLGLMRRDVGGASMRWLQIEPCFVYHVMNAWEEGERLFADVMRFDTAPLFPNADGSEGLASVATPFRWEVDLSGASDLVSETRLDERPGEFPRIDDRYAMRRNRHGWYTLEEVQGQASGLRYLDLQDGKHQFFELPEGDIASEPVFAPRGAAEGDGWLTTVVWRPRENRSDLLVFDALNIAAGPLATAEVPRRVPFGFHGVWLD